jgi:hypothetical protein
MWYKDEANQSHTYCADSSDLFDWKVLGPCITDCGHEGPNVFEWRGHYWMITDPWKGLGVYRSPDLVHWTRQADILATPGKRPMDNFRGSHAEVLVQNDNAYIFYFVHPGGVDPDGRPDRVSPYAYRQTCLQVAKLEIQNEQLVCDRDKPFDFVLESE